VIGSGIMAQKLSGGNAALALLCNTLPTGAILVVLILIFGGVSGAHFNPAVTLASALRQDLPWSQVAPYVAVQIAGGVTGVSWRMRCSNSQYGKWPPPCEPARANGWPNLSPASG
jgi:glycerol uptake facilitator-like aquaporin